MSQKYFEGHYTEDYDFSQNQIDAIFSFFKKKNFDDNTAMNITSSLLIQSKKDNVNPFALLDKFKKLNEKNIQPIVMAIMNKNHGKTSVIGYKKQNQNNLFENRNVDF